MASAVLDSQNDSIWVPMGKMTYANQHMSANPNSNAKKKQKQFHGATAKSGRHHLPQLHSNNFESPVVTQTASDDDAYSINQPSMSRGGVNCGGYLTFEVSTYTKSELVTLRKRLLAELDLVREFRSRIETGCSEVSGSTKSKFKSKKASEKARYVAAVGSAPKKSYNNGYVNGSSDAVDVESLMKECGKIVAKLIKHKHGYVFRQPVDDVALGLHDYRSIVKRPMDLGTVKNNLSGNIYSTPIEFAADVRLTFNNAMLYNPKQDQVHGMAEQLLTRFEELFKPIQDKIDIYFNRPKEEYYGYGDNGELQRRTIDDLQGSSWNNNSNPIVGSPIGSKKAKPNSSPVDQAFKKLDRLPVAMQAHSSASTPSNPLPPPVNLSQFREEYHPSPVRAPPPSAKEQKMGRGTTVRQPKPKAKDPNKRDMNMEEKQKLGLGLQSLPQEKMPQLIQIIRKRNEHLAQDGDEIELDIEALDTETLWELDRFVTNWKKMVSKTKRQALMMNYNMDAGSAPPLDAEHDVGAIIDKVDDTATRVKENEDEDVDIDDDTPAASFPPVDIEKDEGAAGVVGDDGGLPQELHQDHEHDHVRAERSSSSSGSSSSGSSSSSDSDSGSSSGSESDGDDAHS